jgi:Baseplate J-like protein
MNAARARIDGRLPGFLPARWHLRTGRPGAALLAVLARFSELVDESLALAPEKHFLGFLDATGASLLSPTAARAALVFALADDAPTDVPLPAATQVAADERPPLPGSIAEQAAGQSPLEPIVFTTDRSISLARASLAAAVSVLPSADEQADHTQRLTSGFRIFGDTELVQHHLYLGHDALFALPPSATVKLRVAVVDSGARELRLAWEYATEDGWLAFKPVVDQTHGFTVDGEVVLRKACGPPSGETSVNGIASYWIRARVLEALPLPGGRDRGSPLPRVERVHEPDPPVPPLPRVERVHGRVAFGEEDLPLDTAFAGGLHLDTSKDFQPFGPQPQLGTEFTIACDKAFDQAGASIELRFAGSAGNQPVADSDRKLIWEYTAGPGQWTELKGIGDQFSGTDERRVAFMRPGDWEQVQLNGERHRWIRVRISAGGYLDGVDARGDQKFKPPLLAWMRVAYEVQTPTSALDHCLSLNQFRFSDHTDACRWGRDPFQPFRPLDDRLPAVYLGFGAQLPAGLVSLLAAIPDDPELDDTSSPYVWEYASEHGWRDLAVLDETVGFRRTGLIQFVGPADLVPGEGPEQPLYWIRARLKATAAFPAPRPVDGLHLNAVWATHRQAVQGEVLGRSDGSPRLTVQTMQKPVLGEPGVHLEVQEWHGTGREWESLVAALPAGTFRRETDARDRVVGVWVTWQERDHLHSSGPDDRHFTVDRSAGLVGFGDGLAGMVPPPGAAIVVSYTHGGGPRGNQPAGGLSQLQSSVPYLDRVTNPLASSGGAGIETVEQVRKRGPQRVRHRGRALTAADYEWLAHDASAAVALARCLPTTGPGGAWPGEVTVLIAPASAERQPQPSAELRLQVQRHLASRAPAAVAGQIRVLGPEYQPISVNASVAVSDPGAAAAVEERLRWELDRFLHPLTGGPPGGWRFGDTVHLSHVARIVESVDGVDFADELQLSSDGAVHGDRVPIPVERLPAAGQHLLRLRVEA